MTDHKHEWRTRYVTIERIDCPSGMECSGCGEVIHQDDVEAIVNTFFEMIDDLGVIANEILVKMSRLIEGRIL